MINCTYVHYLTTWSPAPTPQTLIMPKKKAKVVWCFNDLEEQAVEWLWPGRLPAGKLTLVDGDPSQGKSMMTLDLASRLTAGQAFPDGFVPPEPRSVVLVSCEDGVNDTVLPRLKAMGADLRRVHLFAGRADAAGAFSLPSFPEDCDLLTETLRDTAARLVIVDPLMAFLSAHVSAVNDQMVRWALGPLARVAGETGAAIVLVRHLTKRGHGQSALYRGGGSIGIIGSARMAYLVGASADDPELHVLACTKCNLATPPPSMSFRIAGNDSGQPVISWAGAVDINADELAQSARYARGNALNRAMEFLKEQLRGGPVAVDGLLESAEKADISLITLRRAKMALEVLAEQQRADGRSRWFWRLPAVLTEEDALSWPERQKLSLEQAQKESDEFLARIRARFVPESQVEVEHQAADAGTSSVPVSDTSLTTHKESNDDRKRS
jgi:hypothetical protein